MKPPQFSGRFSQAACDAFAANFANGRTLLTATYGGSVDFGMCNAQYSNGTFGAIAIQRFIVNDEPPSLQLALTTTSSPLIPKESIVVGGKVQTQVDLVATLTQNGSPVSEKSIIFGSNRGATIDKFAPGTSITSDSDGKARVNVTTRTQPATSILSATSAGVNMPSNTTVNWLPAKYAKSFLVTCYTLADEKLAPPEPALTDVCGLPEKSTYREAFLKDVKMQGSGTALDGTIVHYAGNQCYETLACPLTAFGACATVGTTIAVDMKIIPKMSSVSVKIIGQRKAQDKGSRVKGYHIDEYLGPQPVLCKQLGRRSSEVLLDSY